MVFNTFWLSNDTGCWLLPALSKILMNEVEYDQPSSCLFSPGENSFSSNACPRSPIGKRTHYIHDGMVFLSISRNWGSPYFKSTAPYLMHVTYLSTVSEFSSKWKYPHAWKNALWCFQFWNIAAWPELAEHSSLLPWVRLIHAIA